MSPTDYGFHQTTEQCCAKLQTDKSGKNASGQGRTLKSVNYYDK